MNKRSVSARRRRFNAFSVYFTSLIGLLLAVVTSGILFLITGNEYYSLSFGGFLAGLTGLVVVTAQDLQNRKRIPKVFFHSWLNPILLNKEIGKRTFPIILRNYGYEPGQNILTLLTFRCLSGDVSIGYEAWGEVTSVNITASREKVFQRRLEGMIYPRIEKEETTIGEITIEPMPNGSYDIEVIAEVYEEKGSTRRNCNFAGNARTSDKVVCEEEREFQPYY